MELTTGHYPVFEVFIQSNALSHHQHVGSVVAPSHELALQVARESFLRRDSAISIWVVDQRNIVSTPSQDQDFLSNQVMNKDYRTVAGYTENARLWKRFKHKTMYIEDIVEDLKG